MIEGRVEVPFFHPWEFNTWALLVATYIGMSIGPYLRDVVEGILV